LSKYAAIDGVGFCDMTPYFQDGSHDVRPPLAPAYAAVMQQRPPAFR